MKTYSRTKILAYSGLCVSISTVLSLITVYRMPQGGSVTACSMLFIALPAVWFGPAAGIAAGVARGLLDLVIKPEIYHPAQVLLDYPLAFGVIGFAGFFGKYKYGLLSGFLVGAALRFAASSLSGFIFFAAYAPEGVHPLLYSAGYNASYILPEAVVTCIIISIPAVRTLLNKIPA